MWIMYIMYMYVNVCVYVYVCTYMYSTPHPPCGVGGVGGGGWWWVVVVVEEVVYVCIWMYMYSMNVYF